MWGPCRPRKMRWVLRAAFFYLLFATPPKNKNKHGLIWHILVYLKQDKALREGVFKPMGHSCQAVIEGPPPDTHWRFAEGWGPQTVVGENLFNSCIFDVYIYHYRYTSLYNIIHLSCRFLPLFLIFAVNQLLSYQFLIYRCPRKLWWKGGTDSVTEIPRPGPWNALAWIRQTEAGIRVYRAAVIIRDKYIIHAARFIGMLTSHLTIYGSLRNYSRVWCMLLEYFFWNNILGIIFGAGGVCRRLRYFPE